MKKIVIALTGVLLCAAAFADIQFNIGGVGVAGNNMNYQSNNGLYSSVQVTVPVEMTTEVGAQLNYMMPSNSNDYSIGGLDVVLKKYLTYPLPIMPYLLCKAGYAFGTKTNSNISGMNIGAGLGLKVMNLNFEVQDQMSTFPGSNNGYINYVMGSVGFNF